MKRGICVIPVLLFPFSFLYSMLTKKDRKKAMYTNQEIEEVIQLSQIPFYQELIKKHGSKIKVIHVLSEKIKHLEEKIEQFEEKGNK